MSYPPPAQPSSNAPLPFYQYGVEQRQHGMQDQDGDASEVSDGRAVEPPEDPAIRSQMMQMMGSFGGFDPMVQQQALDDTAESALPPGSVDFAQATGSPNAAPPSQERNKHARTKVSRACDECRRKKIRCDSIDESGGTPCSNCARTGSKCDFSRQPLKRGPSKGYIKELAERLNRLEQGQQSSEVSSAETQRLQMELADDMRPQGLENFDPRAGDKRTYSMTEAFQNELQPRPAAANTSPDHDLAPNDQSFTSHFGTAQPTSRHVQPFWRRGGSNDNRQEPDSSRNSPEQTMTANAFDWDDAVMDEYYRVIHQTFPLLPNNKNRLRQRLADCPTSLRDGFLAALDCTMRTFPTTALDPSPDYGRALKKAVEMLAKYPFDNPSSHTNATNLVYLQTLLLMALEADNHGPATVRGQAGPSRAEWLGRAAGVAGQLEINVIRKSTQSIIGGDHDSEERLARRVWWCLFILDRWHASSTADLLKLPENSVVLLPEDQILLGESTYHLARLSFIIGHLAAILTTTKTPGTDVMSPSNPASSLLGLTLVGEIDRFRESVESVWGSFNLVHLSYHHCHLLIKRLSPDTEPPELAGHAVKVAKVLNSAQTPVTPLNHHFAALAAMTLCELCDVSKTRADAIEGLDQLGEALGTGRGLAGNQESEGWDGAIRELVARKKERMQQASSLDTLADVAGGNLNGAKNFNPTLLTRFGYLTALGQGLFKTK